MLSLEGESSPRIVILLQVAGAPAGKSGQSEGRLFSQAQRPAG
jgi:hypothetical protein